jgi:hypothetical protein
VLTITARHPQHVLALFDRDPMLQAALIASDHPAGAGDYRWPGTAAEFD